MQLYGKAPVIKIDFLVGYLAKPSGRKLWGGFVLFE
jgi:hypothetical protein